MAEYNVALEKSLIDAGLAPNQAKDVVSKAIEQQISYGLTAEKFVPRIPGKMNLPKIKQRFFMKIYDDVIKNLISLPFLKENRETTILIKQINRLKEAEKDINSLKWENFVLEKDGDFSVYLFKNQSDIYKHWNSLANSAKEEIIPEIEARLDNLIGEGKLVASMKDQIIFDIIGLAIYLTIQKEVPQDESTFYDDLYALYQAGYIPCGYTKGYYKVL